MDKSKHNQNEQSDAAFGEIVLKKLSTKAELSKDEKWFYLTRILQVSKEEAEQILHNLSSNS